jgi:hypothetical protein
LDKGRAALEDIKAKMGATELHLPRLDLASLDARFMFVLGKELPRFSHSANERIDG